MTSNIDKLNLIAPLLAGRQIGIEYCDEVGRTLGSGVFHSIEIDNVYPDSEPTVFFRMTDVTWERYEGFPGKDPILEHEYKLDGDEIVFSINRLSLIELKWGTYEGFIAIWFHETDEDTAAQLVFVEP